MTKDFRNGHDIGQELAQAGVKTVILNACDSASSNASSLESNLAEVLMTYNVEHVLAMAYKVVEEAVEIFMNAFYQSILLNQASVRDASRIARLALIKNKRRRAAYMYHVNLSDHIVPVLYTLAADTIDVGYKTGSNILRYLDMALESVKRLAPSTSSVTTFLDSTEQALIGRDIDILNLESRLSASRTILLHGQGGCGKSEFLRQVCQWWQASGWIKGSAYIDCRYDISSTWKSFIGNICRQLEIKPESWSDAAVMERLASERYLLVFDNSEAFESPIPHHRPNNAESLATQLKSFVSRASSEGLMVIIGSRLSTTKIADITSDRQKYNLPGLSALDSVELLQQLVFHGDLQPQETYHRRNNIDYLRRVAILLEGNPTAIQMIVPTFRRLDFNGESLFNKLLYDVIDEPDRAIWGESNFCRQIVLATLPWFLDSDNTLISADDFAPFWNLMPKDLKYYYWFFYLFASKYFVEAGYANWISDEWQDIVSNAQMAVTLRDHWLDIESKLISLGVLQHAVITRRNGSQLPCYHVNPVHTLISRSSISPNAWKEARFAYTRQVLLWNNPKPLGESSQAQWKSVQWEGVEQHEDHLHNWYAQALGWAFEDEDPQAQVEKMGLSLFSLVYGLCIGSWWTRPRYRRLLIPHIRRFLLYAHMITDLYRPGSVPTTSDLNVILSYSWTLYQIDLEDTVQSSKAPVVKSALEIVDRWRAANPPGTIIPPPDEVCWFQLRFAEASIMDRSFRTKEAKQLFERNLADNPVTTDVGMINIIRRWHLQNLQHWSDCVIRLAVRDNRLDRGAITSGTQAISDLFKPKGIVPTMKQIISENADIMNALTVGDQLRAAINLEAEAVSKFGSFAKSIIESPMLSVFADLEEDTGQPILSLLKHMMDPKTNDPEVPEMRSMLEGFESAIHMLAGDTTSAAQSMNFSLGREALSSTTSTGWDSMAEWHMYQYGVAVI
jgi:hypothetical protein